MNVNVPPYQLGFCPVCGYEGWKGGVAGEDYDDCPSCEVDFCQFTCGADDPTPLREAWISRNGMTASAFEQLTRNLQITPALPATWPPIIYVAALGDRDEVIKVLEAGENVDAINERGETALMWAAFMGHLDVVRELLSRSASVQHRAGSGPRQDSVAPGATPIIWAVRAGQTEVLRELLEIVAPVHTEANSDACNIQDAAGISPLMEAAVLPAADCLAVLLDQGADVRQIANDGTTALTRAASALVLDSVCALIDAGAEVDAYLEDGDRPLTLAIRNWQTDSKSAISICRRLLTDGADPNIPSDRDCSGPIVHAIEIRDEELIDLFLAKGAIADVHIGRNPKSKKLWKTVPLTAVSRAANSPTGIRILKRFLEMGLNVNTRNSFGLSPLGSAMLNDNWTAAEMLIEAGADLQLSSAGITPLFYAANYADVQWVSKWVMPRVGEQAVHDARNGMTPQERSIGAAETARFLDILGSGEPESSLADK